ncbi:MAG: hypothetical protein WDZ90_02135 [Candidatus Paceibacterota bacterium]
MRKEINSYAAVLLITIVGAGASWIIISVANSAEDLYLVSTSLEERAR